MFYLSNSTIYIYYGAIFNLNLIKFGCIFKHRFSFQIATTYIVHTHTHTQILKFIVFADKIYNWKIIGKIFIFIMKNSKQHIYY